MEKARRAGLLLRVVARSIDLILVLAAAEILPRAGFLAGILYILIADGLAGGRSLGKRLLGLWVISEGGLSKGNGPCTIKDSILRNFILAVALVLWKIPIIGWAFASLIFALELIVLTGSADGRRIGDEIAKTWVAETRYEEAV
jgi:uncharacterized RDD family membrane protein YckC